MTRIAIAVSATACLSLTAPLQAQRPVFESATPIPIGRGTGQLALSDLNGDGHLDLLVSRYQHGIEVRFGNGRGQFTQPAGPLDLGMIEPGASALGDVTGDGNADLIAAHKDRDNEYISIFPGDGKGNFRRTKRHRTNGSFEFWKPVIKLADVDGNGTLDIVTSNGRRNTIEILLADGRGRFTPAPVVMLTPGSSFYTFGVGDVDQDGHVDLVTTFDATSTSVEYRKGVGNGGFQSPFGVVDVRAGARVLAVADVNADSRLDVVVSHVDTGSMSILLGNLGGSLIRELGLQTFGVVVTDVSRDGRPDIVATTVNSRARPYESKVAVLLGDSFAAAPGSPFPVRHGAYQLAVGDINEDGKADVVTSSFETDSISVLLGR